MLGESQLGLLADQLCREGCVPHWVTACTTRDGIRGANPLSTDALERESAGGIFLCGTAVAIPPTIAGRLGGTHTRRNEMKQLAHIVGSFWRDEDGQDLLEYALLVALIALVAVAGVTAAGVRVADIFNAIVDAIPLPA